MCTSRLHSAFAQNLLRVHQMSTHQKLLRGIRQHPQTLGKGHLDHELTVLRHARQCVEGVLREEGDFDGLQVLHDRSERGECTESEDLSRRQIINTEWEWTVRGGVKRTSVIETTEAIVDMETAPPQEQKHKQAINLITKQQ